MLLLIINSIAYFATFFFFQKRVGSLQVASVVLLTYSIASLGSIYIYSVSPVWGDWNFNNLTLFPFLYLYVVLLISFIPIMEFSNTKCINMRLPKSFAMNIISLLIIIFNLVFFVQTILSSFSISDLFSADILADNYEDKGESMAVKGGNLFGALKNVFIDVLWIMFMYNWVCRKRILALGLIVSIFISVLTSLAWGARGPVMSIIMQMPFAYIVFLPLMTSTQKKQIVFSASILGGVVFAGFWAMTYGRFSDNVNHTLTDIIIYYVSSDFLFFNNYAIDPGGCRYGDRVFPLFRMLLGLDTADGWRDRRLLFTKLKVDDSQFTTFVGEFCIDFGPIVAFAIISFFSFIIYRKFKKKKYDLGDVVLGMLWYHILIYGFTLFVYAEKSGNLRILYLLFFAYLFKRITPRRKKIESISQSIIVL